MSGDLEEAIARFERAAKLGDVHSNLTLGHYYLDYRESDRDKGIKYLEVAAQMGSDEALCALGKVYELGILAMPDYEKAAEYFEAAGKRGNVQADYRLGQLI
jgi:hypothetical protein